jgi:hypothetical protein
MKRRYVAVGLALVIVLSAALPAVGAPSPVGIGKKAVKIAKRADRRSTRALKMARKLGPTGPAGRTGGNGATGATGAKGADGSPGTARAYAQVNALTISYVDARTKGFTGSVAKPASTTGVYCLTIDPALGIDPESVAAVASPEAGNTSSHGGSAEVRGLATGSCSVGAFAVLTFDSTGTASNSVSFTLIVP